MQMYFPWPTQAKTMVSISNEIGQAINFLNLMDTLQ
jgi:hypothetical protein